MMSRSLSHRGGGGSSNPATEYTHQSVRVYWRPEPSRRELEAREQNKAVPIPAAPGTAGGPEAPCGICPECFETSGLEQGRPRSSLRLDLGLELRGAQTWPESSSS